MLTLLQQSWPPPVTEIQAEKLTIILHQVKKLMWKLLCEYLFIVKLTEEKVYLFSNVRYSCERAAVVYLLINFNRWCQFREGHRRANNKLGYETARRFLRMQWRCLPLKSSPLPTSQLVVLRQKASTGITWGSP